MTLLLILVTCTSNVTSTFAYMVIAIAYFHVGLTYIGSVQTSYKYVINVAHVFSTSQCRIWNSVCIYCS
jgi:hypothetical protein